MKMTTEKGQTVKIMREKMKVSDAVKENLKDFNKKKRLILDALKDENLTIAQVSKKTGIELSETVFLVGSLVKFGFLQTAGIDDKDEYFYYKIKKND